MSFIISPGIIVPPLTAGGVAYGTGSQAKVNSAGTAGQVLVSAGAGVPAFSNASSVAVTSFSGGTTGLTPNTPTTGAVVLSGVLDTDNGGTALTSFTSGGVVYASSASALATGSALVFDGANLGLGVTPVNAYTTFGYKNYELPLAAFASFDVGLRPILQLKSNVYYNSGGSTKYITSGHATQYVQDSGEHIWSTAVSGSAGGAVSLTAAMTLDASGKLLVGTTTGGIGGNSNVVLSLANGNVTAYQSIRASGGEELYLVAAAGLTGLTAYSNSPLTFGTNNTERLRIAANGALGLSGANYGTSGQVLTSAGSGAAPTWSAGGTGSMVFLSTVAASSAATVDIETTFDSTYSHYVIIVDDMIYSTSGVNVFITLKINGTYQSGAFYNSITQYSSPATPGLTTGYLGRQNATTGFYFAEVNGTNSVGSPYRSSFVMNVPNPSNTASLKSVYWTGLSVGASSGNYLVYSSNGMGIYGDTATAQALTGVRLAASSGTISGNFRLYGIRNS